MGLSRYHTRRVVGPLATQYQSPTNVFDGPLEGSAGVLVFPRPVIGLLLLPHHPRDITIFFSV
jgi:hypothetical protein